MQTSAEFKSNLTGISWSGKRPADDNDALLGNVSKKRYIEREQGSFSGEQAENSVAGEGKKEPGKRATQACLICRKRKLRCLGGWPCKRCTESRSACDFGIPLAGRTGLDKTDKASQSKAYARLEQLENSVADLLAGLAHAPVSGAGNQVPLHLAQRDDSDGSGSLGHRLSIDESSSGHYHSSLEAQYRAAPLRASQAGGQDQAQLSRPTYDPVAHSVRFNISPVQPAMIADSWSQSNDASALTTDLPTRISGHDEGSIRLAGSSEERIVAPKGQYPRAEQRLAVATEGVFGPPFKALAWQPSVWDNREASRRNSPDRTQPPSRDEGSYIGVYDRRVGRHKDDPINTGIVDRKTAEMLFGFFMAHCHPFFPIVDITLDDSFNTIRRSPPLISAMIAIASRFYNRYCSRTLPGSSCIPLDPRTPSKLVNLAEYHLSQTLLRKQHTLSDVQTILLLAAWCLVGEGGGPDAWVMAGHAVRVARRLGVHDALAQAAKSVKEEKPGTAQWTALERYMPQWRTWLCWLGFDGLFSLGFGRPQSTHLENLDEEGFLQIRLNQPLPRPGSKRSAALYGDIYISGQVQLAQIGRDLRRWGEALAEPEDSENIELNDDGPTEERQASAKRMFRELNARLDEWSKLWVWSGSPYSIYLGSSVEISRLQGEHIRLCLNSYALKYSPDEDDFVAHCLKKAFNAAISTIQTHYQSSQSDFALSFATDYMTITVAQAALFLIRMTKSPQSVQNVVSLDPGVITYYLQMSIDLLEAGDLSETRLSSFLARTIRDIARVAGIAEIDGRLGTQYEETDTSRDRGPLDDPSRPSIRKAVYETPPAEASDVAEELIGANASVSVEESIDSRDSLQNTQSVDPLNFDLDFSVGVGVGVPSEGISYDPAANFDIDQFLQLGAPSDLGYLLGLQSDSTSDLAIYQDSLSARMDSSISVHDADGQPRYRDGLAPGSIEGGDFGNWGV